MLIFTRSLRVCLALEPVDLRKSFEGLSAEVKHALEEYEQDDCRWTPCFDCGVCPSMDTQIQVGPTGRKLLPLTPV